MILKENKGFTLIELLSVIVLLGVIAILVIPNFSNILENSKNDLYDKQIKVIETAAKLWSTSSENKIFLMNNKDWPYIITLGDLIDSNYLEESINNPKSEDNFSENTLIYINKQGNNFSFEVDENTTSSDLPVIVLDGIEDKRNYKVEVNTSYNEPGFIATDIDGTNITNKVETKILENGLEVDNIDTSKLTNYTIKYSVLTKNNDMATVVRRVSIVDTTPPVISCDTCKDNKVEVESTKNYQFPEVIATDNYDKKVEINKIGSFSSVIPGERKIVYSATDNSGNTSILTINFIVRDTTLPKVVNVNQTIDNDSYLNIEVEAIDDGSGIKEYSFDGGYSWQTSNKYKTKVIGESLNISIKDNAENIYVHNQLLIYVEEILNGSVPVLDSAMTPIYYDGTVAKVADVTTEWYSYKNGKWANAVIIKEEVRDNYKTAGTTISEADILAYFVWIPRYEYTIKSSYGVNGTSSEEPGYINIKFVNPNTKKVSGTASYTGTTAENYLTHPAFTFGDEELRGLWVGKFETTGTATAPTIKPNITSLRSQKVNTQFTTAQLFKSYGLENESRMMKNSEWGAVAYLSQSLYGRCPSSGTCPEISINNSSSYITGSSGGSPSATSSSTVYTYNTEQGYTASTTMNITGIYDMSGGAWEYVMGVLLDSEGNPYSGYDSTYNSGYNGKYGDGSGTKTNGKNFPDSKYYNIYTSSSSSTACSGGKCYGEANSETSAWYGDYATWASTTYPWVVRGGRFVHGVSAGLFYFSAHYGHAYSYGSFRVVVSI